MKEVKNIQTWNHKIQTRHVQRPTRPITFPANWNLCNKIYIMWPCGQTFVVFKSERQLRKSYLFRQQEMKNISTSSLSSMEASQWWCGCFSAAGIGHLDCIFVIVDSWKYQAIKKKKELNLGNHWTAKQKVFQVNQNPIEKLMLESLGEVF